MRVTKEQDDILNQYQANFRLSIAKRGTNTIHVCEMVDRLTKRVYQTTEGDSEDDAFNKALATLPNAKKPYASKDAEVIEAKDSEIARLKAEAEELRAKLSGKKNKEPAAV